MVSGPTMTKMSWYSNFQRWLASKIYQPIRHQIHSTAWTNSQPNTTFAFPFITMGQELFAIKIEDGLKAVKGHDKRIGFCADLGHYIRSNEDPVEVIHKLGDRLYGIHLKDFSEQKKRTHGVILGKGHLDVPGVFKALRKIKFPADGALSLEYEETPNDHPKLLADIDECLVIAAEGALKSKQG